MVTFLPFDVVDELRNDLDPYKYPGSIENYGIDGYIVKVYPLSHSNYALYSGDRAYWMDYFTKTKINRRGNKFSKSFLEIGTDAFKMENEKF